MLDNDLIEIFLIPLRKCSKYKPAFGQSKSEGLSLSDFHNLYGSDPFYAWLGLDDPMVYSAHKAAGGLTSVYRQLGVGSERLFRTIISTHFNLSEEQMCWGYEYAKPDNSNGIHTLDTRISSLDLRNEDYGKLNRWLEGTRQFLDPNGKLISPLTGVVFEVRQGYKSADSKRQNADLRFGMRAYQENLLPALAILSSQVSEPVAQRYRKDGMLVLTGIMSQDPNISTYAFFKEVIGYDLANFFQRNSQTIQAEVKEIISKLLSPQDA
ncbi:hypothetical protein VB620_02515 [Nodularia harveyana UHCC-0300]|uniref:Uncharacterized protein n=1 Tax=Nodularia harveyana UHCC-0300 TaxID=2974287 RepID=A0ABU5UAM1_9CYAN|nr:hypothetical protein [Nodularia harveyana]MEA5580209.1 hypothetical protein [Nodularia harveyana UHCC-0300]